MNILQEFIEGGMLIRTLSKRQLKQLNLLTLIQAVIESRPPIALKIKAHLIETLSDLLLRAVRLLHVEINEFEQEHFYAQVKEKQVRIRGGGGGASRRRKKKPREGGRLDNNLMAGQEEAQRQIDEAISSKKNTADKKDINLPPRLPQDRSEDSQNSVNKLSKTDNFRDILNNMSNLPMNNDGFQDLAPLPPSGEKQYPFLDQLRKNLDSDVSRLADEYRDLLETTADVSVRPVSTRKTRKKTAVKGTTVTMDERIDLATLIEQISPKQEATEAKKRQEYGNSFLTVKPIEFIAEELQNFSMSVRNPLLDETRNKFAELHRSIMLNDSLSNTFMNNFSNFDMELPRVDRNVEEGGDLMEFLTGKKSISSRSGSKSSQPSNQRSREGIQPQNLSVILETNDNFSMSPSKQAHQMSSLQMTIVGMITSSMEGGRANLNELIAMRNPKKMLKAQLFVEVLGLNLKMTQERPDVFSDIYVSAE